jgi:hypothetical protein
MRSWARRVVGLHREMREVADLGGDPRWWLFAGGVALPWERRATYVISDAEPESDTFIGTLADRPADPIWDAIARAHAARATLRALDGSLPGQPLAVTVRRTDVGAVAEPSSLEVAAFAIGDRCWPRTLGRTFGDARDHELALELAGAIAGRPPALPSTTATPFVTVTLGDEPLETARHGHRRAWIGNGIGVGPWLGLSRAGGLAIVSTSHFVVDGFGHAWITAEIRTRTQTLLSGHRTPGTFGMSGVPVPVPVSVGTPLGIAWRELSGPVPGALVLGYALGRVLHRIAGRPDARFSPTFQIPVAPGTTDDPERRKRRVVPAIASLRFEHGEPEPFELFAARTRELLQREAGGSGLSAHLLAAAQGAPAPLAWKRRAVGPTRPKWLDAVAGLIGGRGCVSRLRIDVPGLVMPAACAVSSPARLPTPNDPLGGCVVTVIDDAVRAAITVCGAGVIAGPGHAEAVFDEVVAQIVHH